VYKRQLHNTAHIKEKTVIILTNLKSKTHFFQFLIAQVQVDIELRNNQIAFAALKSYHKKSKIGTNAIAKPIPHKAKSVDNTKIATNISQ
jgi:hypoxanthine-guanine phosphoribosyltransferase